MLYGFKFSYAESDTWPPHRPRRSGHSTSRVHRRLPLPRSSLTNVGQRNHRVQLLFCQTVDQLLHDFQLLLSLIEPVALLLQPVVRQISRVSHDFNALLNPPFFLSAAKNSLATDCGTLTFFANTASCAAAAISLRCLSLTEGIKVPSVAYYIRDASHASKTPTASELEIKIPS